MSTLNYSQWQPLTTNLETHLGLAFSANIKEMIALQRGNYDYRNIAKIDIPKGSDVDMKNSFDSYYEVDGERLVQIAKYGTESDKIQCYTGKNSLKDNTTVYYTQKGNLMVKESDRVIKAIESSYTPVVKQDIFANKLRG